MLEWNPLIFKFFILIFLTCFNNYIFFKKIKTILLVKSIVLAEIKKKYIDKKIVLRKQKFKMNVFSSFNYNTKKFLRFRLFFYI